MIQSHLILVIGERFVGPLSSLVEISKLKLGKLYAASIMYVSFLEREWMRDSSRREACKHFPPRINDPRVLDNLRPNPFWDIEFMVQISLDGDGFDGREGDNSYRLRSYAMYLDADTLQRYATTRSKEVVSLIEKQTNALFEKPAIRFAEDGSLDTSNDEVVGISFAGLTILVLEAVAFGSFLWKAKSYVDRIQVSLVSS